MRYILPLALAALTIISPLSAGTYVTTSGVTKELLKTDGTPHPYPYYIGPGEGFRLTSLMLTSLMLTSLVLTSLVLTSLVLTSLMLTSRGANLNVTGADLSGAAQKCCGSMIIQQFGQM